MGRRRRAVCSERCTESERVRDREDEERRVGEMLCANVSRCWRTEQKICTVQQTPLAYVYVQNYVRISWGKSHVYISACVRAGGRPYV